MNQKENLTLIYKENLEENIIEYLAEFQGISNRKAMDIYYQSKLSSQIEEGIFGIENMDYKYLVEDLLENEPELFK